ncbi:AbrB/MazE/SpoVT family DNA-binding domain-containing protein [Hyphomonas sp.]|uniref:AbrB/MazE/SpoVT family DNA-binding domain-containing protein n=1 Tax=Hyphomonas sp. TaxID=87 RepID=UPI0039196FCC
MTRLKIRKIGNSLGVVLPKDVLDMLGAAEGDAVSFARTAHGIMVSVSDAEGEKLREMAADVMKRRRKALKVLAQ